MRLIAQGRDLGLEDSVQLVSYGFLGYRFWGILKLFSACAYIFRTCNI